MAALGAEVMVTQGVPLASMIGKTTKPVFRFLTSPTFVKGVQNVVNAGAGMILAHSATGAQKKVGGEVVFPEIPNWVILLGFTILVILIIIYLLNRAIKKDPSLKEKFKLKF